MKLLVANRGEIAVRVIRTAREMEIPTVPIYSTADAESLAVELADEAVCVGPPAARDSYLNVANVLGAAAITGCDAVHPGYGFLSENPQFATDCARQGITFVGPAPEVMARMGDKVEAKRAAIAAGLPVLGGSDGPVSTLAEAAAAAEDAGYPILLKAAAGGGGRGMRRVERAGELEGAFSTAAQEAQAAFGDGSLYVEKLLEGARHVEVQILADGLGGVLVVGDRECSIQRRHQKVVEEAPSPGINPDMRKRMGRAAVRLARDVGYHGAGTVEFLVQGKEFFFIEVNARVQVEHPVTEMLTGVDVVRTQILVAAGEPLPFRQDDVEFRGHAIECRVNAEDPARNFAPSPGTLTRYVAPGGPGVRVDSHVCQGYRIPPNYDSMIAKLIVHADSRAEAISRMRRALDEYAVEGVQTTIPLLRRVMRNAKYAAGDYSTRFLDAMLAG